MEKTHRYLLRRALDGELSENERDRLQALLKNSPELREELRHDQRLKDLITKSAPESFKPFFSTRVMQRISTEAVNETVFSRSLARVFRRIVIASVVLIIAVMAYNVSSHWENRTELSALELALNLAPAALETSIESITGTL